MADPSVERLLRKWQLSSLIETFTNECVDHEALISLECSDSNDLLEKLIPKIGIRAKFCKHLKAYKELLDPKILLVEEVDIPIMMEISESLAAEQEVPSTAATNADVSNIAVNDPQVFNDITDFSESQSDQDDLGCTNSFSAENCNELDLQKFLQQCTTGALILRRYEQKKSFDVGLRKKLVETIIYGLMETKTSHFAQNVLTNEHFNIISKKIVELFPTEAPDIYYVAPKTEGSTQKIAKGKLVDKYRNWLREYSKLGLKTTRKKSIEASTGFDANRSTELSDENIHVQWLKHNNAPWESVVEHWRSSIEIRLQHFQSIGGDVVDVFKKWPVLKQPLGYTLLEIDFAHKFRNDVALYSAWPDYSTKLLNLMKQQIRDKHALGVLRTLDEPDVSEDARSVTLLTLLVSLCPPSSRIRCGKKVWKPTILESQEGFILHIKVPGDLQVKINQQRQKLENWQLSLQLFVVIVGPTLSSITASYVVIDSTFYLVESPLKAVDICYKAFHVLHAKYPKHCEQVWLLIQQSIYKMSTKWDRKISIVTSTVRALTQVTEQ